jgi:hypothetical protein
MKKLLLILPLLILSCSDRIAEPIDKYRNKGIVFISYRGIFRSPDDVVLKCKTKDSLFEIRINRFDMQSLQPGDTIK